MVSNNIPTQHISSLIMKQKYLMDDNGETNINYCIDFGSKQYFRNIFIPFIKQNIEFLKDGFFLPSELNIGKSCLEYKDLEYHLVTGEDKFFTKTSAYSNTQELMQARDIATQDYFRFALDQNLLNTTTCSKLQNTFDFLNMNQTQFLKSFVLDGYSLSDIYAKQRPDLPSIEQLMNKALSLNEEDEEESYDSTVITETSNWIDNALKTLIGYNSNIVFKQTANCSEASLVIIPRLDPDAAASDLLLYENDNKIVTQQVELVMPTTLTGWSETMHSIAHIYEDHYNENGKNQTDENELELYQQSFKFGSVLTISDLKKQSLLPHDIEALNLEYPPKAKNITFELNNLKTHFGYDLVNNGLVTLANVGNTAINASNIKSYSIDLRSEHLSTITSSDNTSYSFLLSYRTEISQIKLDQTGSITLSDNFRTNIILSPDCYDLVLHSDFYQSDTIMSLENKACVNELPKYIDIYNYNSLIHSIDFE